MELNGKTAVVTGGAQGLGRCICQLLLEAGVKVCLADVDEISGKKTVSELASQFRSGAIIFCKIDVTKEDDWKAVWSTIESKLGKINLLVNNAGIVNEKNWRPVIDVNFNAVVIGTNLAIEKMSKEFGGTGGTILNIASRAGLMAAPLFPIYAASKFAVVGLTRCYGTNFHLETTGIRHLSVCPAMLDTKKSGLFGDSKNAFDKKALDGLHQAMKTRSSLQPMAVAKESIKAIQSGPNGGCVVVEDGYSYYSAASVNTQ